ncbi:Hypothetical predicted protein [Lecanosticta acicola]|uniref:Uncharacterized protein n=1 Tax=Lecanosticta acicola TaxID=111012 RepID=A0AAI9EEK1_9PEZI|nr:Hypothetical predicted protein [Lecanosticta acicola]
MSPKQRIPKMVRDLRAMNASHSVFDNHDLPTSEQNTRDRRPIPSNSRSFGRPQVRAADETDDMRFFLASSQPESLPVPQRRAVKQLATQLQDQCAILIEEKLFTQALQLYSHSLTSGVENDAPAYVPLPQHIALVATLAVHPKLTTQTLSPDDHAAADDALKYLRHLTSLVNIDEGGIREAFRFVGRGTRNERPNRGKARHSDQATEEEVGGSGTIRGPYANKQSLWKNAEDLWSVVGWAFNCSIKHKLRWERWKLWLELMLDVLESDLEASRDGNNECSTSTLRPALLAQYLSTIGEGRNNHRRIMYAIIADGTPKSMAEFGEIWQQETRTPKRKAGEDERPLKKRKLDLDNEEYGDYFDEESGEDSLEDRKRRSRSATTHSTRSRNAQPKPGEPEDEASDDEEEGSGADLTAPQDVEAMGGIESIRLRQRFLVLLSRFSWYARDTSLFIPIDDLFDLFTEFIKPLPVPVFQQFILPTKPYFGNVNYEVSLCDMLCAPLLGTNVADTPITQSQFEEMFAAQAALNTSAADNAKASLLIESLLRALWKEGQLVGDARMLRERIEQGITARNQKVAFDGRKRAGKNAARDDEARTSLHSSSERMRIMVDIIAAG